MRKLLVLVVLIAAVAAGQAPAPEIPDSISIEKNIPYDKYPETVLDILQSKEGSKDKRPGVLCIHGGGWVNGTKESFVRYCLPFVKRGFVVANVEYRQAKAAPAPAAVNDVLKAAEWFRKNAKRYRVDMNRIIATGSSAGGHLALMTGLTPKSAKLGPQGKIAAVVNFCGITDVADQISGPNLRKYAVTWIPEQPQRLELARRVSPMTYVRKGAPPVLTIHGDADQTVPYEQGANLTKALRDVGVEAEMITVPQGKHGFPQDTLDKLYPQIFEFLKNRKILK